MEVHQILSWFDLFDWALTPEEYAALGVDVPENTNVINGFVVALGRENLARLDFAKQNLGGLAWMRRRKSTWAWRKLKKARRWTRVLGCIPFVRMIAIGNALGYGNCRDESDIDLVIVTAPHRVWLVRLFIVGLLRLFRQRPGEHGRDALCPSFFLSADALCLGSLQIDNSAFNPTSLKLHGASIQHSTLLPPDPYLLFWMTQLTVLYDVAGTYDLFWKANEQWIQRWLPNAQPRGVHPRLMRRSYSVRRTAHGDLLECWARRIQERRFPAGVRAIANTNGCVILNDRMIKLHTNDRRAEYRDRWHKRFSDVYAE